MVTKQKKKREKNVCHGCGCKIAGRASAESVQEASEKVWK